MTVDRTEGMQDIAAADAEIQQGRESVADMLTRIALEETELFHTPEGVAYATIATSEVEPTWKIHSTAFREWLGLRCHRERGKSPGSQSVTDALTVISGYARHDGDTREVHIRVAGLEDRVYLDLGDEDWSVVEVTPEGWRMTSKSPVRFRRAPGMLPLPVPVSSSTTALEELRGLLNVEDADDWLLTQGWLLAALSPRGPYPIMELVGEAGSAKSTHARVCRGLIDPSKAPLRKPPREGRDVHIAANNSWVIAYDNLSELSDWLADDLCRLSTGGGFSTRALYTDDEEAIFDATRPIVLTGVEGVGDDRTDLPDRTMRILKPRIRKRARLKEDELVERFERIRPRVLGVLLDAVAVALGTVNEIEFGDLPRMADAAAWIEAAGRGHMGWDPGEFIAAYDERHAQGHQLAIEASIIGPPLVAIANNGGFSGSSSELLAQLEGEVDEKLLKRREWPKSATQVSKKLRRLAPDLRGLGFVVEQRDRRADVPIVIGSDANSHAN
jgi:hypothetical protein